MHLRALKRKRKTLRVLKQCKELRFLKPIGGEHCGAKFTPRALKSVAVIYACLNFVLNYYLFGVRLPNGPAGVGRLCWT